MTTSLLSSRSIVVFRMQLFVYPIFICSISLQREKTLQKSEVLSPCTYSDTAQDFTATGHIKNFSWLLPLLLLSKSFMTKLQLSSRVLGLVHASSFAQLLSTQTVGVPMMYSELLNRENQEKCITPCWRCWTRFRFPPPQWAFLPKVSPVLTTWSSLYLEWTLGPWFFVSPWNCVALSLWLIWRRTSPSPLLETHPSEWDLVQPWHTILVPPSLSLQKGLHLCCEHHLQRPSWLSCPSPPRLKLNPSNCCL